jgi:hypothetical protein
LSKTRRAVGSYGGENYEVAETIVGQARPFVLKNWFESSPAEKDNPGALKKVDADAKVVDKIVERVQNCSVDENGVLSCVLPQGRRPDPPRPLQVKSRWRPPSKDIFRPFLEAVEQFEMIRNGDRILVCLSGGKDSLTLLHTMRQYQVGVN